MKRLGFLFAVLGWAVLGGGAVWAEDTVHLAFLGDSNTDSTYLPADQRLDQVVLRKLKALYPQQKLEAHNAGKSGATIPKFVAEGGAYQTKAKAPLREVDVCFIQFGCNDEDASTPDEFKKNLEGLCDRALADFPGVKIVLCTSTSGKSREWWEERGMSAEEPISLRYYSKTRALAQERGYPVIDIYACMVDAFKKGDWDLRIRNQKLSQQFYGKVILDDSKDAERKAEGAAWFKDGHLNPHGMDLVAECIAKGLKDAFAEALPNEGTARP